MSLLDSLFGWLGDSSEETARQVEHPCSNCPGSCSIAPEACSICQPYKEQLIDALYRVEHKDEILSQYEVVGTAAQTGSVKCPHCGGNSENPYVCEYCGSTLQEGSQKIQVASANDIPNPVLEAQNIIFARYDAVRDFSDDENGYGFADALSGIGSQGLFSSIFEALTGADQDADSKSIGNKMTESEIEEMAAYYDVSVSKYLAGLDIGQYLTLSNKNTCAKAEESYSQRQSRNTSGMGSSMMGLAGALGMGSLLFGGSTYNRSAAQQGYDMRNSNRRRLDQGQPSRPAIQPPRQAAQGRMQERMPQPPSGKQAHSRQQMPSRPAPQTPARSAGTAPGRSAQKLQQHMGLGSTRNAPKPAAKQPGKLNNKPAAGRPSAPSGKPGSNAPKKLGGFGK